MVAGSDERRIQVAFRALRTADERSAPSFAQAWARVASQRRSHRRPGMTLAIEAAALLVAVGVIFWFSVARSRITPETTTIEAPGLALATWTSPTDFLLMLPSERVFSTVPTIRDSIVNRLLGE